MPTAERSEVFIGAVLLPCLPVSAVSEPAKRSDSVPRINRAKDAGDIKTLREIAEDPHGFILRQGWASLDFSDGVELAQLRRLHETLQLEIIAVLESLNQLRESPDYELCRISEQKPGVLDELAAARKKLLEKESDQLQAEANRLSEEIKELSGEMAGRIL